MSWSPGCSNRQFPSLQSKNSELAKNCSAGGPKLWRISTKAEHFDWQVSIYTENVQQGHLYNFTENVWHKT